MFLGSLWRLWSCPGQIWSTNQRCDNLDKGQQSWDNHNWNWWILAIIATRWIWDRCRPKWRFSWLYQLSKVGGWPMQRPRLSYPKRLHRMSHTQMTISTLQSIFLQFSLFLQDSFPCLRIRDESTWLVHLRTLSWIILFKNKSEKIKKMFRLGTRSILQKIKPVSVGRIEPVSLLTNQIRALSVTPQQERHLWLRKKKSFGHPYSKTHPRNRHFK